MSFESVVCFSAADSASQPPHAGNTEGVHTQRAALHVSKQHFSDGLQVESLRHVLGALLLAAQSFLRVGQTPGWTGGKGKCFLGFSSWSVLCMFYYYCCLTYILSLKFHRYYHIVK